MKIGILTYHRSQNFGALLQAIALRKCLANLGHEVYFIDYWPDYHRQMYKVINWDLLKMPEGMRSLYFFVRNLWLYGSRKRRYDVFNNFISKHILTRALPYNDHTKYDAVIYGSDQIWRKQPGLGNKFNPVYFGDNIIPTDLTISYAASMGSIHSEENDKKFLNEKLSKFHKVLVRESSLMHLLEDCGIDSSVVVDPTLLLTADDWIKLFDIKTENQPDYLLFYDLQKGNIPYYAVKEFAKRHGLKIKVVSGEPFSHKESDVEFLDYADPATFVNLFYNAKFVLTSSYHGLVFSLLFNKDFYTIFKINKGRAESLLKELELSDRMLAPDIQNIPDLSTIDYTKVNKKIKEESERSIRMLKEALSSPVHT